jgi:anaerobic selenocysteine-containing dehydrogenase
MGHFGVQGSGILHSTGSGLGLDAKPLSEPHSTPGVDRRVVSHNDLGAVLNSAVPAERVEVLIVQGANPALMNLDQSSVVRGLRRDDLFTVVHEQVMTDTARYADVILPATTHFEAGDIAGSYGAPVAQRFDSVIDRVGESRTNAEFFADLGRRLGLDVELDAEALLDQVTSSRPIGTARAAGTSVQFVDTFPTRADRKLHLGAPEYVARTIAEGRLTLLSPASSKTINSLFGERHEAPTIHINTSDAAARSIVNGQRVVVSNEGGRIELTANVTDDVRPGVVMVYKGFWSRAFSDNGVGLNALIPYATEPLADGACFNDATVLVAPL